MHINTRTFREYVCKPTVFLIESGLEGTERIVPAAVQNSIIRLVSRCKIRLPQSVTQFSDVCVRQVLYKLF